MKHNMITINDLNYGYIEEYMIKIGTDNALKLSKDKLIETLNLIDKYGNIKDYAILMFADKPKDYIPGAYVKIHYQMRNGCINNEIYDGPLWVQVFMVKEYLRNITNGQYIIRESGNIYHRVVKSYLDEIWIYLVVYIFLYKDYSDNHFICIDIYLNRISFIIKNKPILNPSLLKMFQSLHYIKSYDTLLDDAKVLADQNGNKLIIHYNKNSTRIIIYMNKEYQKYLEKDSMPYNTDIIL